MLLAGAAPLHAAIVYFPAAATTPVGTGYDESGVWFDFFTGEVTVKTSGSGALADKPGLYQLMFNSAAGYLNLVARSTTTAGWTNNTFNGVERLASGRSVSDADIFTGTFTIMASTESWVNEWDGFGRGYVGVRFNNEAGEAFHGYADVTVNTDYTATLHGFAYQNIPSAMMITGAVPEPTAVVMAGLGVVAFCGRRKRGI